MHSRNPRRLHVHDEPEFAGEAGVVCTGKESDSSMDKGTGWVGVGAPA